MRVLRAMNRSARRRGSAELLVALGMLAILGNMVASSYLSARFDQKLEYSLLLRLQSFYDLEVSSRALLFSQPGTLPGAGRRIGPEPRPTFAFLAEFVLRLVIHEAHAGEGDKLGDGRVDPPAARALQSTGTKVESFTRALPGGATAYCGSIATSPKPSSPSRQQCLAYQKTVAPPPPPPYPESCFPDNVITFENLNEGEYLSYDEYARTHGVTFTAANANYLRVAQIKGGGESEPSFEAWLSAVCDNPNKPKHNRLCVNPGDLARAGRKALSTRNAMDTKNIQFGFTFSSPTRSVTFDFIDMDGNEVWDFDALDVNDQIVSGTGGQAKGYGADTGNNAIRTFSLSSPTANIKSVRIVGTKNIKIFGFAIDNIQTGHNKCP